MTRNFLELLKAQCEAWRYLCIELSTSVSDLPPHLLGQYYPADSQTHPQLRFNQAIVDATSDVAGSYMFNLFAYLAGGTAGYRVLTDTVRYIHAVTPDALVILDCLAGGDTTRANEDLAETAYDAIGADAVTCHGYTGARAMQPILQRRHKGAFVLCRTLKGRSEFQDAYVETRHALRVWERLANEVYDLWNTHGNCGLLMATEYPAELTMARSWIGELPILLRGEGIEPTNLEGVVYAGIDAPENLGLVSLAASIVSASTDLDFAEVAGRQARLALIRIRSSLDFAM